MKPKVNKGWSGVDYSTLIVDVDGTMVLDDEQPGRIPSPGEYYVVRPRNGREEWQIAAGSGRLVDSDAYGDWEMGAMSDCWAIISDLDTPEARLRVAEYLLARCREVT